MKLNLPVTQVETPLEEGKTLVSKTDLKGVITDANPSFVKVSGFTREELIGSSHNIVRHPDVPAIVFEDLWNTIQSGRPWSQIVKNRCKSGDHYWVEANAAPIIENNEVVGYISVRRPASRDQIALAETAYKKIESGEWVINEGNVFTSQLQAKLSRLNLFKRLKVSQKLVLTAIGAFSTIALLLGVLFQSEAKQIDFRDKERMGVELIQSFRSLAEHLPQHRGMGNAFLNGAEGFEEKLNRVEQQIKRDFDQATAVANRLSAEVDVTSELKRIHQQWAGLKGGWKSMPAAESFAEHSELIGELLSLVTLVGDRSNLILDPDLDTFYLMDVVVNQGMQLADITGQLRGFGSGVVAKGVRGEKAAVKIRSLKLQGELLMAELQKSILTAAESNEVVQQRFSSEIQRLERAITDWEQMVEVLSQGDLQSISSSDFFSAGTAMIGTVFSLTDGSAEQLMTLLTNRVEDGEQTLLLQALFALLMILLLTLVTWRLVRSISGPLGQAEEVLLEIASGNYNNRIRFSGKDEVANLLAGLKSMQIKAGADRNEIIEKSNETSRIKVALDGASTNVMIANNDRNIVYMNPAVTEMLRRNERAIQQELPSFRVDGLLGNSIDSFHKNPQHQAQLLSTFTDTFNTQIRMGGRVFTLSANPVISDDGERLGASVEWNDVTEQVQAEEMVEELVKGAVDGNLTNRLESSRFDGFMQRMAESINSLMDTFNNVLVQTRVVIDQVNESVGQVRVSSQDLASAAEEQSSAVEQVSTSLEETDSQVKSNAENANVANQLVQETNSVAGVGQTKMKEMIQSMDEISGSSQDIAKIIKVIDEIAFQTNLLALNAAVEAARAGKYGKGFAVVAQEVRDLAGRSAEAAKETADLIEQSTRQVSDGVKVAGATAESLEGIVENVVKVRDLVAEISTASEEQTKGIMQVNEAMAQISEGAQSGSQQSMEMASAADQLASLTDQLSSEVARFQLKGAEYTARPAVAAAAVSPQPPQPPQPQPQPQPQAAAAPAEAKQESSAPSSSPAPSEVLPLDQDERDFGDF